MRFRNLRYWRPALLALLLVLATSFLFAQSAGTGSVAGTISDVTGASVPGAQITLVNQGTNQTRTIKTGSDGSYRFNLIEIGQYTVRVSATGFKTSEVTGVTVSVSETPVVNRTLEVGQQSEQVTVTADAEAIQTATSTLGTTVNERTINAMPLSSRNFTQVLGMSAGVATDVANGAALGKGTQNPSVNGSTPYQNNIQMDGVTMNNAAGQGTNNDGGQVTGVPIASPDALQEFKIQTSTFDASYGRNPGANVNVVTKSGTNKLHGSAFEYFRNEKLNANSFFQNRDGGGVKQVLKNNQFGGTLGGPIIKDKVFLFGSYQGTRQRNGIDPSGSSNLFLQPIPTGDRSRATFQQELGAAMCTQNSGLTTLFNIVNVACDGSNINPVAIKLLQVKLPNGAYYIPSSGTSGVVNRNYSDPTLWNDDQYITNGDWIATSKHTVAMRMLYSKNPEQDKLAGQFPGRTQFVDRSSLASVLRVTSALSPTFLNQFRVSGQRLFAASRDTVPYTPQEIGVKPMVPEQTQPPWWNVLGFGSVGGAFNPYFSPTNTIQIADQISKTMGNHTFRAGGEYENFHWPLTFAALQRGFNVIGSFSDLLIGRAGCAPADTACSPANPGATNGTPFSNILNCLFCVRSSPQGIIHGYDMPQANLFVQDDWRVNSRLTLNLGLRWEYFGMPSDRYGNLTNLSYDKLLTVPTPPTSLAAAVGNPNAYIGYVVPSNYDAAAHGPLPTGVSQHPGKAPTTSGIPKGMFGPRFGFAWQPMGGNKFVVRGGFGIFYDRISWDRFGHAVQEGKPYADTISYSGAGSQPYSLQTPFTDRPLGFSPRWYDLNTLTGSAFNSPTYGDIGKALTRQYNLGVQYEFLPTWVMDVAFVGNSAINQSNYSWQRNTARLASPSNPINGITTNTIGNASARVPILGFQPAGFQGLAFNGIINYTSLQATLRKQFSRGLATQVAYTWSRNLTTIGNQGVGNSNHPDYLGQQYGQAPYARNQRLILTYNWELPFANLTKGDIAKKIIGGWSLSGLTTVQSGNPLTFADTRGGTVYGVGSSTSIQDGTSRAQMAPGKTYGDILSSGDVRNRLRGYFNANAFAPPPVIGTDGAATDFGNSGVGIVNGPGQFNWDISLVKMITVREGKALQFRTEFFNAFNHAQFSNPVVTVGDPSFGTITSTSTSPRLIQLALKFTF